MCLRFVFLLITRTASWLRLSRRQETWRIAEILILRHQLAVLQRRQPCRPKLNWADRALLATLLGAIPKARRHGLRLLVTPDTILRWHRDIVRRRWAARSKRGNAGLPIDPPEHQGSGPAAGPGEPRMGLSQDPRGTGRPGSEDSRLNGMGDSEKGRNRPRAAPIRAYLAAVPAFPGRGDPGVRLLHRRPARRHPGPCPGRHRARHQAHPHPRSHLAPNRRMDRPASSQPDHGPRRAGASGQVHDPRPWLELHDCVRRGPRRRRDPHRALQHADAPHERDSRTLDRRMPPRAFGPHPHLESEPSAADPAPVRDATTISTGRTARSTPLPR